MAKITDKIAALPPGESFNSLEFFPPKTEMVCASGMFDPIGTPRRTIQSAVC